MGSPHVFRNVVHLLLIRWAWFIFIWNLSRDFVATGFYVLKILEAAVKDLGAPTTPTLHPIKPFIRMDLGRLFFLGFVHRNPLPIGVAL